MDQNNNIKQAPNIPPFLRYCSAIIPTAFDDSLSYYEALCALYKWLQDNIVDIINNNAAVTQYYIDLVKELKSYVENYFDNLDVQEEINNKLDEMVEDGTFDTILANYLVICGGNPKAYGAKGDGETDDTEAINSAITSLKEAGINKLVFPKGEYVISDSIEIPSNFVLEGMPESTLKYVGEGTDGNIISIQGEDAENYKENIVIRGITINGTGQVYKGGYSMSTPKVTHTNPCAKGLMCVNARFVRNITIENCNFEDVYGDGIVIYYANNVHINRNTLRDVSSGNIQTSGQTGYDNHGDGIVTFFSFNAEMDSNTVINKRVYQDGISAAIGKPCGRSGLEFEYAINQNTPDDAPDDIDYNAPNYSEIPLVTVSSKQRRYGVGLRMTNNYVYGYTKGIHLESRVKAIIDGNTLLKNHIGIICSVDAYTTLTNNYFNPFGVGTAPQGGYDAYYSGIGVTNYADPGNRRNCLLISGNTFDGDGKGVTINNNYVTIENNKFFCQRGIFTQSPNLIGINIFNNTFNSVLTVNFDYFLFLYNVKYSKIKNNTFYSEVVNSNTISGDFIEISSNEFVNTSINHNAGNGNLTIRDNTVKGNLYTDHVWIINYGDKSLIDNNEFNIEDFNTSAKNIIKFSNSTADCVFSNNKFLVSTTRNDLDVVRCEVVNRCKFINNYFKTNINVNFIRVYVSRSCDYINNKVENTLANVIYHTGQFEGCTIYEGNVGTLGGSGSNPNDSTSKFVNQFYSKSQKLYKYNIANDSTEIGWICTSEGYYTTTSWSSGNTYNVNSILKNSSDKVYKCITKGSGTSTVEPTHTTFANVTETDGYEWQYLGSVATFSTLSK